MAEPERMEGQGQVWPPALGVESCRDEDNRTGPGASTSPRMTKLRKGCSALAVTRASDFDTSSILC